jgi:hypothetical protein
MTTPVPNIKAIMDMLKAKGYEVIIMEPIQLIV